MWKKHEKTAGQTQQLQNGSNSTNTRTLPPAQRPLFAAPFFAFSFASMSSTDHDWHEAFLVGAAWHDAFYKQTW